ncbi:TPA: hypothetical protein ACH3X2_012601 [Trebouxia sp. C0005]
MLLESLPGGHGDACLGITHLRSPAKSMHGIAAFNDTGPFLPDEAVQQFLSESRNLAAGLWEPPSCVDFKPVGTLGRRAGLLDIFGMAALVCQREFKWWLPTCLQRKTLPTVI